MRWKLAFALSATTVVAVIGTSLTLSDDEPAGAAGNRYGTWTVSGADPAWRGTMVVGATGFPHAAVATDSSSPTTPSSAVLDPTTPFGAEFGGSGPAGVGGNALSASTSEAGARSVTTLTFAAATPPAGWGFAVGDVDTDSIQVAAVGPAGPLTSTQLGFRGVFNACTGASPRPAGCPTVVPTDVPRWDAVTATLRGTGVDTSGASGWFTPTVPITSMTVTYTAGSADTGFQMWVAADTSDISGTVRLGTGGPAPSGSVVMLRTSDDTEIARTRTASDGTYRFAAVPSTIYAIEIVPAPGDEVVG
ncbi:MAG: carboxypeptidase-like regulatory domain-containing protein, partial [Ilumatobacteraceae bacterium]